MTQQLYSTAAVAQELGLTRQRVRRLALSRGLGRQLTGSSIWWFTADELDAMRVRKPGRPQQSV